MFAFYLEVGKHTVRSRGSAAIGVVTKLMDVHTSLSIGIIACDIPADSGWGRLGFLLEDHGAGDLGVTSDRCNCSQRATC